MFRHFHGARRSNSHGTGKWQRRPHSGVVTVLEETAGAWDIRVTHRRTGTTIRRDVFHVCLRSRSDNREELLTGFSSKATAMAAGRKRVAMLSALKKRSDLRRLTMRRPQR